jgi:phage-related protein
VAFDLVSKLEVKDHFTMVIKNAERQVRKFTSAVEDTADKFRDVERSANRVVNEIRGITNTAYGATAEIYQMDNAFNLAANSANNITNEIQDVTTAVIRSTTQINRMEQELNQTQNTTQQLNSTFNLVEQSAHQVTREVQQTTNEIQQAAVAAAALGTTLNGLSTPNSGPGGLLGGGGGSSGSSSGGLRGTLMKTAAVFPFIIAGASSSIAVIAPLVKLAGNLGATLIAAGIGTVGYAAVAVPALAKVFTSVEDIAEAEEKLAKADTYKARIKAQKELDAVYSQMSKSQAKAVKGLQSFKGFYSDFAAQFEQPVFDAFSEGLTFVEKLMKSLEPTISGVSTVVVDMMQKLNSAMEAPAAVSFFDWIAESAGPSLSNLGKIVNNTVGGIVGMFQAFKSTTGDAETGLINLTQRFEEWGQSLGESQGFKDFVAYAEENGPVLMETFGNIIGTVENLIAAFAPMGTDSLETIRNFTGAIETLSEKMIGLSTEAENLSAPIGGVGNASKLAMGPVGWLALAVEGLTGDSNSLKDAWSNTWDSIVSKTASAVQGIIGGIQAIIDKINEIPGVEISDVPEPKWVSNNAPVPMSGAPKQTSLQQPFRTPTALRNLPIQFPNSASIRGYSDGLARVKNPEMPALVHRDESILTAAQSNTLRGMGVLKANGDRPVLDTDPLMETTKAAQQPVRNYSQNQAEPRALREVISITIAKLAEQIIVREEADIDKLAEAFANKIIEAGELGA